MTSFNTRLTHGFLGLIIFLLTVGDPHSISEEAGRAFCAIVLILAVIVYTYFTTRVLPPADRRTESDD